MLKIGIITQSPEAQINLDRDLYIKLAKEFKKLYVIDLSFNKKKKIKFPRNFVFLKPKNTEDIKKIFSKKKFFCFNFLAPNYSNLGLLFLLKKYEIKHFYLMRSGTLKMNEDLFIKKNNWLNFYQIILRKIFFKILTIFNLIYNYEVLFISQKIKKIFYHSKRNQFLNRLFNTNKFFLYKRIVQINDKTYDLNYNHKNIKAKKLIAFIDTTLNQPSKISSVHKPNEKEKLIFYARLRKFFKLLSKKYKMKLFICLHPKTSKKEENMYFKGIRCHKYKTSEIIKKSYLNIFLSSTLISDSIFLKKNILLIRSKLLGNFHNYRVNRIIKKFKLKYIDLDYENFDDLIKNIEFPNSIKSSALKILSKEINIKNKGTGVQKTIKTLKSLKKLF